MVKTSDCGSDMHGFESHQTPHFNISSRKRVFFIAYDGDENPFLRFESERAEGEALSFTQVKLEKKEMP